MKYELRALIVVYACIYARALDACGSPYVVFISLLDVKNRELLHIQVAMGAFPEDLPSGTLTRPRYQFGQGVLDSVPEHDEDCAIRLRRFLDHLANAAGLATPLSFDGTGRYKSPNIA